MSIELHEVTHVYMPGTPHAVVALEDVTLKIEDGEALGIIGPTGSGKSTLVQHLNGLLKPTRGRVVVDGQDLAHKSTSLRAIRRKVGVIFQYPEHQLFEETIAKDIAFGPLNTGVPAAEMNERVRKAMAMVGLSWDLAERSPFELSGGQMRRVAIAGVLAMRPQVLVLDEPTAGLDPRGRNDILKQIQKLHTEHGVTLIIVSHNMEDIARMTQRLVVMKGGRIHLDGSTAEVFARIDRLTEMGMGAPQVVMVMDGLRRRGYPVKLDVQSLSEARDEILSCIKRGQAGA